MPPIYHTEVVECRGMTELINACKSHGKEGYEVKAMTESQPNIDVPSYYTVVFQKRNEEV